MNIEECISKLKRQITVGKCEKNIGIPVYISDLETLLTAYEKEKEKNKELEKQLQSTYQKQYINDLEAINHSNVSFN